MNGSWGVRVLGAIALAAAVLAGGEAVAATRESVIRELGQAGYSSIRVQRTWLGRTRFVGTGPAGTREVILNPSTGQILRDHVDPAEPAAEAPAGRTATSDGGTPARQEGGGQSVGAESSAGGGAAENADSGGREAGGAGAGGGAASAGGGAEGEPADPGDRSPDRSGGAGRGVGDAVRDAARGGGRGAGGNGGVADAVEDALDGAGVGRGRGRGE